MQSRFIWPQSHPPTITIVQPPPPASSGIADINGFNWSTIANIDAKTLILNKDKQSMQRIQEEFLDSTTFYNQNQAEIQKLFSILQVIMENDKQTISRLKNAVKKLTKTNDVLKNESNKKKSNSQKCPICLKNVPSLSRLDAHMFHRHPSAAIIWQNLRTPHQNEDQVFSTISMAMQPQQNSSIPSEIQEAIRLLTDQQKKTTKQLLGFKRKIDDLKSTLTLDNLTSTTQIMAQKQKKESKSDSEPPSRKKSEETDPLDHVVTIRPSQQKTSNKQDKPKQENRQTKINKVPFDQQVFETSSGSDFHIETSNSKFDVKLRDNAKSEPKKQQQNEQKPKEQPQPIVEKPLQQPVVEKQPEKIEKSPQKVEKSPQKVEKVSEKPKVTETKPKPAAVVVTTNKQPLKKNVSEDNFLSEPDMDKPTNDEAPSSAHPNKQENDEDIEFEEFHNTPAQRIRHSDSMDEEKFPTGFSIDSEHQDSFSGTGVVTGTTTVPPPNIPYFEDESSEPSYKGRVRNFSETGEVTLDQNNNNQYNDQDYLEEEQFYEDEQNYNGDYQNYDEFYNDQYNETYNPEYDKYYENTYNPDDDKYYENTYNPDDDKYYENQMYSTDPQQDQESDEFQATQTKTKKVYNDVIPKPEGMTKRQYVHALASSSLNSSVTSPGPRGAGVSWKPNDNPPVQNSPPKQKPTQQWEDDDSDLFDPGEYDDLPELPDVSSSPKTVTRKGLLNF